MSGAVPDWMLVSIVSGALVASLLIGALLFGVINSWLVRKHHERHFRVGLGAPAHFVGIAVALSGPVLLLQLVGRDWNRFSALAGLLGAVFWLWITRAGAAHKLPFIGGPISTWELALARFYAAGMQKRIAKLEAVERNP